MRVEKIQENSRSFVVLGNGGLNSKSHEFLACGTEGCGTQTCAIESEKATLDLDSFEVDIQPIAVNAGLQLAHAISSARGKLGELAGLGVLFDIPRGLNEIDAFNPELRRVPIGHPRKISNKRLEKGSLPTADDFAIPIREKYLKNINVFNLVHGAQFRLSDITVLTAQRARREIMRMVTGEEGYPDISHLDPSELVPIYSRNDGAISVKCAGVSAATNWVFYKVSGRADIYAAWVVDQKRVKDTNRRIGALFAQNYLGVHKVVDRLIRGFTITHL